MIAIDYEAALMLSGVFTTIQELRQRFLDTRKDPSVASSLEKAEKYVMKAMKKCAPDPRYWDELACKARFHKVKVVLVEDRGEGAA